MYLISDLGLSQQYRKFCLKQVGWLPQTLNSSVLYASHMSIRSCVHWMGQKLTAGKGIFFHLVGKHFSLWA